MTQFNDIIKPMLCGTKEFDPKNCIIEQKFDGIRAIITCENDKIILQSRTGKPLNIPVIKDSLITTLPSGCTVDGEIVASDGIFESLRRKSNNVIYIIYDILFLNEKSLMNLSLKDRLVILNETITKNEHVKISKPLNLNTMGEIDNYIKQNQVEGIVAKSPDSIYEQNSRRDWQKYKIFKECSAKIISYTEGKGKRKGIMGAINIIPENSNVLSKCGSGFTDENLIEMKSLIDSGKDIIVNIKYFEKTKSGCLRFPIFINIKSVNENELFISK